MAFPWPNLIRFRALETSEGSAALLYTWTFFVVLTLESKGSCWVVWTEAGTCCFEEKNSPGITCCLIHSYSFSQGKEWWLRCVSWDPVPRRLLTAPWLPPSIAKLERKKNCLTGVPRKCYKYVKDLSILKIKLYHLIQNLSCEIIMWCLIWGNSLCLGVLMGWGSHTLVSMFRHEVPGGS